MKIFEIHDLTTKEILSDNLDFDDVPELFAAYSELYPSHNLVFCERIEEDDDFVIIRINKHYTRKTDFNEQWLLFVDENLSNMY